MGPRSASAWGEFHPCDYSKLGNYLFIPNVPARSLQVSSGESCDCRLCLPHAWFLGLRWIALQSFSANVRPDPMIRLARRRARGVTVSVFWESHRIDHLRCPSRDAGTQQ
jgi:hypothetical protein